MKGRPGHAYGLAVSSSLNCSNCGARQKVLDQAECLYCKSPLVNHAPAAGAPPSGPVSSPLPEPSLRLVELCQALSPLRKLTQNWSILGFAAASLVRVPGSPRDVAARLYLVADQLKARSKWTSALRQDSRFGFAAGLLRLDSEADTLFSAIEQTSRIFREMGIRRNEPQEAMASLLLMEASGGGLPSKAQVERLCNLHTETMRHHSSGLHAMLQRMANSGPSPALALLTGRSELAEDVAAKIEQNYQALKQQSFRGGTHLMVASTLLCLVEGGENTGVERFNSLYSSFKGEGLRMHTGDYEEVAVLAILNLKPGVVVKQALADRTVLRGQLAHRPNRQLGFDLATHTALAHLSESSTESGVTEGTSRLSQALALLQIKQVMTEAMAAAV